MWTLAARAGAWLVGSTTGYLAIGVMALALLGGAYVWGRVDGASICDGRLATAAADYAEARDRAVAEAESRRAEVARRYVEIDAEYTKGMADAQDAIDRLRADVAAGRQRLRFAARCPAAAGVPQAAGGAGLGDAAGPELGPDAREAYYDLRRQHREVTDRLAACQAILRAERAP